MKSTIALFAAIATVHLGAGTAPAQINEPAPSTPPAIVDDHEENLVNKAVKQASRISERAIRDAKHALEIAQARIGLAENEEAAETIDLHGAINKGVTWAIGPSTHSTGQPLIVRTTDTESGTSANLQEDMAIMNRIISKSLERELGKDGRDSAMGIVLFALPGNRRPQCLYLEGYGALFLANVRIPLVPPLKEEEKIEKPSDSTWDKTKQELYSPRTGAARVWEFNPGGEVILNYDADQVENLKKELTETLRYATNIRGLKPDDFVTIAVTGSQAGPQGTRGKRLSKSSGRSPGSQVDVYRVPGDGAASVIRESTMTIRGKKSDIDAYANGKLTAEEFRKHAMVSTY